jgi:hypothetical protein
MRDRSDFAGDLAECALHTIRATTATAWVEMDSGR